MEAKSFNTPILFIIFNRPSTAQKVFNMIRQVRPTKLYVGADGARSHKPDDAARCAECRSIIEQVDWPCEVHTLFQEKNLGCGEGPSTAITWFFEQEEAGIIVEDDCLPSQSFFPYAEELLEKYRDDSRVMMIAANNIERPSDREKDYSYTFSSITYCWGWATWRRAWKHFDFKMSHWKEIQRKKYLLSAYRTPAEKYLFEYIFSKMHEGDETLNRRTIWDYQWQFAVMINSGLVIVPNRNLVENLGFGEGASNTIDAQTFIQVLNTDEMEFPLRHPEFMLPHRDRELRTFQIMHTNPMSRFKARVKQFIPDKLFDTLIKPLLEKRVPSGTQWKKAFG